MWGLTIKYTYTYLLHTGLCRNGDWRICVCYKKQKQSTDGLDYVLEKMSNNAATQKQLLERWIMWTKMCGRYIVLIHRFANYIFHVQQVVLFFHGFSLRIVGRVEVLWLQMHYIVKEINVLLFAMFSMFKSRIFICISTDFTLYSYGVDLCRGCSIRHKWRTDT